MVCICYYCINMKDGSMGEIRSENRIAPKMEWEAMEWYLTIWNYTGY